MAENNTSLEWELQDDEVELNNMILKGAYVALDYLGQIPKKGGIMVFIETN